MVIGSWADLCCYVVLVAISMMPCGICALFQDEDGLEACLQKTAARMHVEA